ncbi:MAG: Bro-N domain-containing protein [Paludibacteraceae bacterium]|nr:Bro-N domain-containing protein [Paludibacteraceae bacterium]
MSQQETIKQFESQKVRTYWDDEQEKWFFCINDVVTILTGSSNPANYIKQLKHRDPELAKGWLQIVTPLSMPTPGGRQQVNCTDLKGAFRIIQSIPSKKAEPIKQWMASVAAERLHQMQDPERGIQMSLQDYKRLGYSDNWINQRLKSIEIRKDLTDQWDAHGVEEGVQYATLTDIIYQAWAGLTAKEYKHLKGLHQENLRDNMTNEELVMNMLAELTTTNIEKAEQPQSMSEHAHAAARGGEVAKVAREAFEQQTGKKVVSSLNAKDYFDSLQPHIDFEDKDPKKN